MPAPCAMAEKACMMREMGDRYGLAGSRDPLKPVSYPII